MTAVAPRIEVGASRIHVHEVEKKFGDAYAIRALSLQIEPGQSVILLGPSGCGKTTLLRCISGLERPTGGSISIDDTVVEDPARKVFVAPERRGLGMVFQHYALWPHMTVRQNIGYPLSRSRVPRVDRAAMIQDAARMVGMEGMLGRRPDQLSGGQQQRVALARALARQPRGLLLDEPLSNLDTNLRRQLRVELRELHRKLGMTMVYVTHDQDEAAALADVVVVMDHGRIVQTGTPGEILDRPSSAYVANFVGFDNLLAGTLAEIRGGRCVVALGGDARVSATTAPGGGLASGSDVLVAVKSTQLTLRDPSSADRLTNCVMGTVTNVSLLGNRTEIQVAWAGGQLTVGEAGIGGQWRSGQPVAVEIPAERAVAVAK